ncbi:MAG: phosphatidylglycerophosphatase A [Calditrichaeota bacterium]|nr:MAG: phosphatidylglycerophosphatase A [Calditrichota bacterium]
MKKALIYSFGTGLGTGFSPVAPGTAGSTLAVLVAYFLFRGNQTYLLLSLLVCLPLGIGAASWMADQLRIPDPSIVVIDEVVGMWVALLGVAWNWKLFALAFVLFRLFDVVKPPPVRQLESLHGGLGIMLDDVMAGFYALVAVHLIGLLF